MTNYFPPTVFSVSHLAFPSAPANTLKNDEKSGIHAEKEKKQQKQNVLFPYQKTTFMHMCAYPRFYSTDQWGVMHDGKTAYPGAVDCIDRLSQAGKKIVRVHLIACGTEYSFDCLNSRCSPTAGKTISAVIEWFHEHGDVPVSGVPLRAVRAHTCSGAV